MQTTDQPAAVSKAALWTGWVMSAIPVLMLIMSGAMKLMKPQPVVEMMTKLGWPEEYTIGLGVLELTCAIIYAVPQAAVLGAILMTGYLGGAIATHVRTGDFQVWFHVLLGVLVWLGLYLRDPRFRALAPLRNAAAPAKDVTAPLA
jgi:hypothetical protein